MNFIHIIIILSTIISINGFFSNPLKKLKEKAKNYYKKTFGKEHVNFLGHDLTEYPGTNSKYRNINQDKWNKYYSCLVAQEKHTEIIPEAVQCLQGKSIMLNCKICLSPMEQAKLDSVEWFWAGPDDKYWKPIEYTEHILISPETKTLQLYNLQLENTGQYLCKLGKTELAPYFLTLVNKSDSDFREVHVDDSPIGPYPKPPDNVGNVTLTTTWEDWSPCSTCGQVGRKSKIGFCTVNLNRKLYESNKLDIDLELLQIFKFGIPCDSHILPNSIKEMIKLRNRKSEIMTGFCKIECPEEKIFEVLDKNGKVLEKANNSAGIYSMLQGIPSAEPTIERQMQYANKDEEIILSCPGNLNSEIPMQWQIGSKNVVPDLLMMESKGRIFVSITDKIHIKKGKLHDTNIYSCWQNGNLAGTIRLIIEDRLKLDFNHHIMLLGMITIMSTFLYVFIKVFVGRKYVTN